MALSTFFSSTASCELELDLAHLALLGELHRPGLPLALDARVLRGNHRALARLGGLGVAGRPHLFDLEVLIDLRLFLLLSEQEPLLGGLELRLPHRNVGVSLDLGALLAVDGDDLRKLAQADGVEGVVLVEGGERRLVEPRQRDRIEENAVLLEIIAQQLGDTGDEFGAVLMQAVHRMARGDRLHRVDEAALEQVAQAVGRERFGAERLRRSGDALRRRHDAHVEFEFDIDAQAVLGDGRFLRRAPHLDAQRAHIDLFDLVQERQRQAAAGDQNALAAETGAHQRDFARRFTVEAVEEHHRDRDNDYRDRDGEQPCEDDHVAPFPFQARA